MPSLSINFVPISDINPYVFPNGWTNVLDNWKIVSGTALPTYSNIGVSLAIVNNPPTIGTLEVDFTINHDQTVFSDYSGAVFCNSSGTGYYVFVNGNAAYIAPITAGVLGSNLVTSASITYSSGDSFKAVFTIATNTITFFQSAVSTVTPILNTNTSITYISGMAGGIATAWNNSGASGIRSTTVNTVNLAPTINSITNPITLGSTGNSINTNISTLTNLTLGGVSVTALSAPSGVGTFSANNWTDNVVGFDLGTLTVVATDGTSSPTTTTVVQLPTSQSFQTLTSVSTGANTLGYYFAALGMVAGDKVSFNTNTNLSTATNNIGADSTINTTYAGTQFVQWRKASTGLVKQITITNGVVILPLGEKFLRRLTGNNFAEVRGTQISLGTSSAGKNLALNGVGYVDSSAIPLKTFNGYSLYGLGNLNFVNAVIIPIDFGSSFIDYLQVVVTGQSWVTANSIIMGEVSPDYDTYPNTDPAELILLDFKVFVTNKIAGTGFTLNIYTNTEAKGTYKVNIRSIEKN